MGQCTTPPTNRSSDDGGMISKLTTPRKGGTTSSINQNDAHDLGESDHYNQHSRQGYHPSNSSCIKNHGSGSNIVTPNLNPTPSPQSRDPKPSPYSTSDNNDDTIAVSPMNIDARDEKAPSCSSSSAATSMSATNESQSQFIVPSHVKHALPTNATLIRCYKLDLNAEPRSASSSSSITALTPPVFLGPYTAAPTHFSSYDSYDEDDEDDDVAVAIQTAQLFRGITVSPDGIILSQNERATRCCGDSSLIKGAEKSRQAAMIDKANERIEQNISCSNSSSDDAQLLSLVVIGEYDDLTSLVQDGSKKLRDADGLPDRVLHAMNRPRGSSQLIDGSSPTSQSSEKASVVASPSSPSPRWRCWTL